MGSRVASSQYFWLHGWLCRLHKSSALCRASSAIWARKNEWRKAEGAKPSITSFNQLGYWRRCRKTHPVYFSTPGYHPVKKCAQQMEKGENCSMWRRTTVHTMHFRRLSIPQCEKERQAEAGWSIKNRSVDCVLKQINLQPKKQNTKWAILSLANGRCCSQGTL